MPLYQVISHWSWWNALTYEYKLNLQALSQAQGLNLQNLGLLSGVRVRIPMGKGSRVGFVLDRVNQAPKGVKLRAIDAVLDEKPVLPPDLWNLALWMGKTFLCGTGTALWMICPENFLKGEPVPVLNSVLNSDNTSSNNNSKNIVREQNCFDPRDSVRMDFYRELITGSSQLKQISPRTLALFPDEIAARKFFESLPSELRENGSIMLWPSASVRKKGATRWDAWLAALSGRVRVIIAPPSGVFAPIRADRIIVEDEANPGYLFQHPTCHARSLAGHRTLSLGAELVLGGRMPSARTFLRIKPENKECKILPDKNDLVLADIHRAVKLNERGVEGNLPVTISLLRRTRETLNQGRNVLWILDRKGGALEVFCSQCGHAIQCSKCGGLMRSIDAGKRLKCYRCGRTEILPERCPSCKGELWSGKRPGLESLKGPTERKFPEKNILLCEGRPTPGLIKSISTGISSLVLGTRGALPLCDVADFGLIGWLDIDSELRRVDYNAHFNAFNMVWDSLWRGREKTRTVVLQCRQCAAMQREGIDQGWGKFWNNELAARAELELPPLGLMVQVDLTQNDNRRQFIEMLESAGLFVMDPGEAEQPLWIQSRTIAPVAQALMPRFDINNARQGFPSVIVHAE